MRVMDIIIIILLLKIESGSFFKYDKWMIKEQEETEGLNKNISYRPQVIESKRDTVVALLYCSGNSIGNFDIWQVNNMKR